MLYPTEVAKGKIKYLPLLEDASNLERIQGLYAAFVPPEPLEVFLENQTAQNGVTQQWFETDLGEVKAYTQEAINAAFETAPRLVLRSTKFVMNIARNTPELHQQFEDGAIKNDTESNLNSEDFYNEENGLNLDDEDNLEKQAY